MAERILSTADVLEITEAVAPAWVRYRDRLFESARPASEWLVERVAPRPGQTILEVAAGPGETGFLVAERLGPTCTVISTDLSPTMVEAARQGAEARGLANVDCRVMDVQEITLPNASVDGVICRFGLMFAPDPTKAFGEVRRVLRRGGRMAYAVWGPPERNPWVSLLVGAVVESGNAPAGDPLGPGPFALASPDRNRQLLGTSGFGDVEIAEIDGVMRFDDFDDYWAVQSTVSGPLAVMLASLAVDEVTAIQSTLEPMLEPFRAGAGYEIPSLAVAISAT